MRTTEVVQGPRVAVAVRGCSKAFGGTFALTDFAFEVRQGEVHALVGGNGSGKSTFIKVLAGVHLADAGTIETASEGEESLTAFSPERAHRLGLRFVHQNLGIVPTMSLMDNLALGHGYPLGLGGRIRWREWRNQCRQTLARFGIEGSPDDSAQTLSTPNLAMLAVARVLQDVERIEEAILVFDEPTAALAQREAQALLRSIRDLADRGAAVIFVTHRLEEVQLVADRVTAVRDGVYAGTENASEMTHADIVELLLGHPLTASEQERDVVLGDLVLEMVDVSSGPIDGISLSVRAGECVGVAGLLGSGRTELLEVLFGIRPLESGTLTIDGTTFARTRPSQMKAAGVAIVPEDRGATGVFDGFTVAENITAGHLGRYFIGGRLRHKTAHKDVVSDLKKFGVKAPSVDAGIETLSGGNQQKVVLARWLREEPRLLLLDEPTQGIDVGAREDIYGLILQAKGRGMATVIVSSEFEELTRLCDRIVVLTRGQITEEVGAGLTAHNLFEKVLTNAASTAL